MLLRGANGVGYSNYPDNVIRGFIKHSAEWDGYLSGLRLT